ncbi:peptidylprolyl isomerase [Pseudazoarcus pumilus]|uniref:peptidylprolyl isomerase n=1 Tax=Pseudazoarcus pumilus TaxID=2067960 RepID=A0A2I6S920_9RHOO|nr:peptidylprolyl isomerase [Pseudazoarcus pumilus]AUN95748.1 peptidylprolyl isomerase [Pseudazoarcus pumilus]
MFKRFTDQARMLMLVGGILAAPVIHADTPEVLVRLGDVEITALDVEADLQRFGPKQRELAAGDDMTVRRIAGSLLYWRVLAKEAEESGLLEKDPVAAARLRHASERALGELYMLSEDNRTYPTDRVEALARADYVANQEKFREKAKFEASHILLRADSAETPEAAAAELESRKNKVLSELAAGRPFEEVAKEYSEDPGSAAAGGSLGEFETGSMVREFDKALSELGKPGDLSPFVESRFGWHLIRLDGMTPARVPPFEELRDQLVAQKRQQLAREHRQARAEQMQTDPNIEVNEQAIEDFVARHK